MRFVLVLVAILLSFVLGVFVENNFKLIRATKVQLRKCGYVVKERNCVPKTKLNRHFKRDVWNASELIGSFPNN